MGAQDDFGRWEREFDGTGEPDEPGVRDGPDERSGHRGALAATTAMSAGCALLIWIGQIPLAIAGLVVSVLILTLWWLGM